MLQHYYFRGDRVEPIAESVRTKTGVYALLAIALLSNIALLVETAPSRQSFDTTAYLDRFSAIRADLPKNTTVGYLTDADSNATSTQAEFGLAQYALIPSILANNPDEKWVMANVHTPQSPSFYQSRSLELVHDYGNGVMLLRKAEK